MTKIKIIDRFNDWLIAKGLVPGRFYYVITSIIIFISLLMLAIIHMSTILCWVAILNWVLAAKTIGRLQNNDTNK